MPSNRMAGVLFLTVALLGGALLSRIIPHNATAQDEVASPCVAGPVVANEPAPWPTAPSGVPGPLPGAPCPAVVETKAAELPTPPTPVSAASPEPPPTAPPAPPTVMAPTGSSEEPPLPSGPYLQHRPQYFPPSPDFPLNRELAAMEAQAASTPPQPVVPGPVETPSPTALVRPLIIQACLSVPQNVAHPVSDPLMGTHPCKFDTKTGLALAASVRDQLGENVHCLFVAAGPDKTIAVYTAEGLAQLLDRARSSGNDVASVRRAERLCFSRLEKVKIDDAGNCVLPTALIRYAGITDGAVLVGVGDHFELWDAKAWDTWNDSDEQPSQLTPERVHGGIQ